MSSGEDKMETLWQLEYVIGSTSEAVISMDVLYRLSKMGRDGEGLLYREKYAWVRILLSVDLRKAYFSISLVARD